MIISQNLPLPALNNAFEDNDNFLINGDCRIAQAGTGFSAAAGVTVFPVDHFQLINFAGGAVLTASQLGDHPILRNGYCVDFTVTTADAAVAAADLVEPLFPIEGYDVAQFLNDEALASLFVPLCISFWVKSNVTGTLGVTFSSGNADRNFPETFTINAADTWQYCVMGVIDSNFANGGTWQLNNSARGACIQFNMMAGSNYTGGTAGVWNAASGSRFTTGQVNRCANVNNYLRVTDVKLQRGLVATTYKRQTFQRQLAECQRYYWQTFAYGTVPVQNIGSSVNSITYRVQTGAAVTNSIRVQHPVPMRATPTLTTYSPQAATANWYNISLVAASGAPAAEASSNYMHTTIRNPQVAGDAAGHLISVHAAFNARI